MPTLQKRPKSGMKMAESRLFMDLFPPNHHRMLFLIHKNNYVKYKRTKRKKWKKLGLKVMMLTLQKQPKFCMKMAESWPLMDRFPPNHHRIFSFFHKNNYVKSKRKTKKRKKLGLKAFFVMMTTLQKQPKFGMKMAKSQPFMDRLSPNHHKNVLSYS